MENIKLFIISNTKGQFEKWWAFIQASGFEIDNENHRLILNGNMINEEQTMEVIIDQWELIFRLIFAADNIVYLLGEAEISLFEKLPLKYKFMKYLAKDYETKKFLINHNEINLKLGKNIYKKIEIDSKLENQFDFYFDWDYDNFNLSTNNFKKVYLVKQKTGAYAFGSCILGNCKEKKSLNPNSVVELAKNSSKVELKFYYDNNQSYSEIPKYIACYVDQFEIEDKFFITGEDFKSLKQINLLNYIKK